MCWSMISRASLSKITIYATTQLGEIRIPVQTWRINTSVRSADPFAESRSRRVTIHVEHVARDGIPVEETTAPRRDRHNGEEQRTS